MSSGLARGEGCGMQIRVMIISVATGAALCLAGQAADSAGAAAGSNPEWGVASPVPGVDSGFLRSMSCASAGYCVAGGSREGIALDKAFLVTRSRNIWHRAFKVPGLDPRGESGVTSVSCPSPGNCSAGGYSAGHAFLVSQVNGSWQSAVEVDTPGSSSIDSLSCSAPGNCTAGGSFYTSSLYVRHAFLVNQTNGTWHRAIAVPGLATLDGDDAHPFSGERIHLASVAHISCASVGNCTAAGYNYPFPDFVVTETNGTWQPATALPGFSVYSLSCASAGNCNAGGYSADRSGNAQAFLLNQVSGVWQHAVEVPGIARLNQGGAAYTTSVSCTSPGNCSAGGYYTDASGDRQAFVASRTKGTWRAAIEVPGIAALGQTESIIDSVSCSSPGNCSAIGIDSSGDGHAFLVDQVSGVWHPAFGVLGLGVFSEEGNNGAIVSCGTGSTCSAGGSYFDTSYFYPDRLFLVSQT